MWRCANPNNPPLLFLFLTPPLQHNGKKSGNGSACYTAIYWEGLLLVATALTLGLMYAFLGTAEVPVTTLTMDLASDDVWAAQAVFPADAGTLEVRNSNSK